MIKIKSDKIIVGEKLFDGFVYVDNGKIVEVSKKDKPCEEYDYTGYYVSAGFIDMHTHGAGGYAFMNSTVEDVIAGCDYHLQHGTTSIVPTISAGEFETMRQAVVNIHKAKGKEFDVVIVYEGRYQSRIVSKPERIDQARLNLRVAVTRAKKCALILTPEEDPCPLL